MYEQAFDRIDTLLRTTTCQTELDYIEQTSWLLFLKYLDGQEKDSETTAKLAGKTYKHILDPQYRWGSWAMPKDKDGNLLHDKVMNGDDLIAFVDGKLFPYLRKFKERADSADTVEYKIGAIFSEMRNKVNSGFTLRDILAIIDGLEFGSRDDKHELSALYEEKIRNMGNAGRNGGEYYTPRPLIRAMIKVIDPKIGEKVYDGAVGSAGFLCEAYEFMSAGKLTTSEKKTLSEKTFYGKEKKPLAYVIAIMNLMLHGVKAPNIVNTNTLAENINDIQEKDRYEIVLANPPFGGKEREEVQENFPIKTSETASLFLQHFIKILKAGGRGAIVIKNTFLSNTDNGSVGLRKKLLAECNLHTVLDCPSGTFQGAGVKTVVLFFEKGKPTKKVWFYQLDPGRKMGKTSALADTDLEDFLKLAKTKAESPKSWTIDVKDVDAETCDLSVRNPNTPEEARLRSPAEIIAEIERLDTENTEALEKLKGALMRQVNTQGSAMKAGWKTVKLGEVCSFERGLTYSKSDEAEIPGITVLRANNVDLTSGRLNLDDLRYISAKVAVDEKKYLSANSIIVCTASGSRSHLGKTAHISKPPRMTFGGFMGLLRPSPEIDSLFLFYLTRSDLYRSFISGLSSGTNINNLKGSDLLSWEIPLPPLTEQKRIVALLDKTFAGTEELNVSLDRKMIEISELKASLLVQALAGELTA